MHIKKYLQITAEGVAFVFIFTGSSMAGWGKTQAFYPGGHMMGTGYMGWMMIFFWGLILLMIILVLRWVLQLTQVRNNPKTPLDVLKNRLASGEIDIEEYQEKKPFLK